CAHRCAAEAASACKRVAYFRPPAPQLRAVLTDLLHDVANPIDDEHWLFVLDVVAAVRVRDVYGTGKQLSHTVLSGELRPPEDFGVVGWHIRQASTKSVRVECVSAEHDYGHCRHRRGRAELIEGGHSVYPFDVLPLGDPLFVVILLQLEKDGKFRRSQRCLQELRLCVDKDK